MFKFEKNSNESLHNNCNCCCVFVFERLGVKELKLSGENRTNDPKPD